MSLDSSGISNEIDTSFKEVSHIIKERYFSNKWFFSTIITILLLNGKGILYFSFAPIPEKLLIIKGFDYGVSFLINDIIPSVIFSAMFLTLMPRLTGFVNEKLFYKSEMYQKKIDIKFMVEQQNNKGTYVDAEIMNGKEYKKDVISLKLKKAINEYEEMCERAKSLEAINNSINERNERLKVVNQDLEIKLKHESDVCEQVKLKSRRYFQGAEDIINKFIMNGESAGDIESFKRKLNELHVGISDLRRCIDNDEMFKAETIGS